MKVLICDADRLFAQALAAVLADQGKYVVGHVGTAAEVVRALNTTTVDVCVMGLSLPADDGVDAITTVLSASPHTKLLVAAATSDPAILARAVEAGARGLAVKGGELRAVLDGLERVHAGDMVMDVLRGPGMAARKKGPRDHHADRFLTPRERQVLELLVQGASTAGLAEAMGVRCCTARRHIQSTLSKLDVHSRLEAVAFALGNGIVAPPRPR